jgi:hypothetical protein
MVCRNPNWSAESPKRLIFEYAKEIKAVGRQVAPGPGRTTSGQGGSLGHYVKIAWPKIF